VWVYEDLSDEGEWDGVDEHLYVSGGQIVFS
jgi:hypothetical protein